MAADRKDWRPDEAWSDIPDPLAQMARFRAPDIEVPAEPSATRGQVKLQRLLFLGSAVLWPVAVFFYYGGGWRGHGVDFVAAQFTLWAAFLMYAGWVALSTGARGVGRPVPWLRSAALGAPFAFILLALFWLPPNGKAFGALGPPAMLEGCFEIGLTVAIPMLVVAMWATRRAFPSGAVWRGAALGAACGLGGVVVLVLLCGSPFGGHIAVAHGLPLVIATLVGAWSGRSIGRA